MTKEWSQLWGLDPEIIYLNHGAFGACPLPILAAQQELRLELEREPVRFFEDNYPQWLDRDRQILAQFLGCHPHHLVFVPNATTGLNLILKSLPFSPGDELLTTNQEYPAGYNTLSQVCQRTGATLKVASLPFPVQEEGTIIEAVLNAVTPRTRLILIDHVTSQTGLILPIAPLIKELRDRGIETLIDGAHAPGMIPLYLDNLGADYYTGNCHKWLCAPKGSGFLYVHPDKQSKISPLIRSHGGPFQDLERSPFWLELDWSGTIDPTPYFCVPRALQLMGSLLPGGWEELRNNNHQKAVLGREILLEVLGSEKPCPDTMLGSMASLILPPNSTLTTRYLFDKYKIEVPIIPWQNRKLIRISAQIYNTISHYQTLASVIK